MEKGYDFIKTGESLPIIQEKLYDAAEEGEIILAEGSFQKLVRLTDLESGNYEGNFQIPTPPWIMSFGRQHN